MASRIMIAYDGTRSGEDALAFGRRLCQILGAHPVVAEEVFNRSDRPSNALAGEIRFTNDRGHSPLHGLRVLAHNIKPIAMVVGSVDLGTSKKMKPAGGGTRMVNGAAFPVAIAPVGACYECPEISRICVGVNPGPASEKAVLESAAIAQSLGVGIKAVHVDARQTPRAERIFEKARRLVPTELPVHAEFVSGDPAPELAKISQSFDLTFIGSGDKGPLGRILLGSVAQHLMTHAKGAVMVVPRHTRDQALFSNC